MWLGFADDQGPEVVEAGVAPADDDSVQNEVNDLMMTLLPWLVSVLLHVGVVLLAVFIVWSTVKNPPDDEVIVPTSRLSQTPGAPLTQQTTERTTQSSSSSASRSTSSRSLASSSNANASSSLASKVSASSSLIGAVGGGGGGGGSASPFGAMAGAQSPFRATFFGTGGNAKKLVYLVDASGSLIDTLPFVILELKRSIGELNEQQKFTVLFFQGDDYIELPPPGLQDATADYKQRVIRWIDPSSGNITPMGLSSPIKALQRALTYRPHLLFILSDNITGQGQYEVDQRRLIREIQATNKANTKINTIQFLYDDPLVKYNLPRTLELVAQETGGEFKFFDGRELGIQ